MEFNSTKKGPNCPYCRDTGWILYRKWVEDVGYEAEFGRPCDRCNIHKRTPDKRTGVPEEYIRKGLKAFDTSVYRSSDRAVMARKAAESVIGNTDEWIRQRTWLYLWSKTSGSGKTLLASIIANYLRGKRSVRFISAPEYLKAVGDSYKRESGSSDPSAQYRECEVLILDDLGAQKKGEWQDDELFKLIDGRMKSNLLTVITANNPPKSLNVNERIINRLLGRCIVLPFPEESIREKKAMERTRAFEIDVIGGR